MHQSELAEIVRRDPRYALEAYEFMFEALSHAQELLGRVPPPEPDQEIDTRYHVSGPELLEGVRDLALREFGFMARVVFRLWGINTTDDVGEIIFNLIEAGRLCKTDADRREDFQDVFDWDEALLGRFRIEPDEADWIKRGGR